MTRWTVCGQIDCPTVIPAGSWKCVEHLREVSQARGSASSRGYGVAHRKAGDAAIAGATHCSHCGEPFTADRPVARGHKVALRNGGSVATGYTPTCRACNSGWLRTGL